MKTIVVIFFCFLFIKANCQPRPNLPYQGGSAQFDKEVQASLIMETGDSGRVYLVEISYSKIKRETEFVIHGARENDLTTKLIRSFFKDRIKKWDKEFLKKANVLIPLFISPINIYNSNALIPANLNDYAIAIANSFKSKVCYLYKPVYQFRQETQIDIEPD